MTKGDSRDISILGEDGSSALDMKKLKGDNKQMTIILDCGHNYHKLPEVGIRQHLTNMAAPRVLAWEPKKKVTLHITNIWTVNKCGGKKDG